MKDTASTSVEACLAKLGNIHMVGNPSRAFRDILLNLCGIRIDRKYRELRRIILEDAIGLKRRRDPLVLQALKHIRREEKLHTRVVIPRAASASGHSVHSTLASDEH